MHDFSHLIKQTDSISDKISKIRQNQEYWKEKYLLKEKDYNALKHFIDIAKKEKDLEDTITLNRKTKKLCQTPYCKGFGNTNGISARHYDEKNCPNAQKINNELEKSNKLIEDLRNQNMLLQNQINFKSNDDIVKRFNEDQIKKLSLYISKLQKELTDSRNNEEKLK